MSTVEDRADVGAVLSRYFVAVDREDGRLLRSCFTEDAVAEFAGVEVGAGPAAIAAYLLGGGIEPVAGIGEVLSKRHHMTTQHVEVAGDNAASVTYGLVHLVVAQDGARRLCRRGVSYDDQLLRSEGRWLIDRRVHSVDWMTFDDIVDPGG